MNSGLVNRMANLAIRASGKISRIHGASSTSSRSSQLIKPIVDRNVNIRSLTQIASSAEVCKPASPTNNQNSSPYIRELSSYPVPLENTEEVVATGPDGTQYCIPLKPLGKYAQARHAPKLKPHIVRSRLSKLKTMVGNKKNIRHSPWRLNLICQFAAGMTVEEALLQLKFVNKVKAPLVAHLIHATANNAKVKHDLLPSQLEVAECFATHGTHLKRIKTMGRGRAGKMHRRFSHIRLVLREIDFPLKIVQCTSINQRNKWIQRMNTALEDQEKYQAEKEEIEELEREVEEMQRKKKAEEEASEK